MAIITVCIEIMRENMRTAPEDSDRTEYASFAVEMVKIECIALEMNHLNHCRHYNCLAVLDFAIDWIPSY